MNHYRFIESSALVIELTTSVFRRVLHSLFTLTRTSEISKVGLRTRVLASRAQKGPRACVASLLQLLACCLLYLVSALGVWVSNSSFLVYLEPHSALELLGLRVLIQSFLTSWAVYLSSLNLQLMIDVLFLSQYLEL